MLHNNIVICYNNTKGGVTILAEYEIKRSKRKSLCIEITRDAKVLVRAPYFTTQKTIEKFVVSHESWINKHLQKVNARPVLSKDELEHLKALAKEYIPNRVNEICSQTGLSCTGVKITTAATRWGSCSPKNSLCFSCRLMKYPKSAIDYVIVHELCHTVHHNHQKPFWNLVEKILPNYKQLKSLLK